MKFRTSPRRCNPIDRAPRLIRLFAECVSNMLGRKSIWRLRARRQISGHGRLSVRLPVRAIWRDGLLAQPNSKQNDDGEINEVGAASSEDGPSGGFQDRTGSFGRGGMGDAGEDLIHTPVAGHGEDRVCPAVTDAPLKFTGFVPRLAQRFIKIQLRLIPGCSSVR